MKSVAVNFYKLAATSVLLFSAVVQCAKESTKTLFMIDHPVVSPNASGCNRKDHKKSIHSHYTGKIVTTKNLDTLVDTIIGHFNHQKQTPTKQDACSKPKLAIFDIDNTALTEKKITPTRWPHKNFIPIDPILRLYNNVIDQGYHVAFVTWRIELPGYREKTVSHLHNNGFSGFQSLHMRPKDWNLSCTSFKESVRNTLAQEFDIVMTLDDTWSNLCGTNTGDCLIWVCDRVDKRSATSSATCKPTGLHQNIRRLQ